jgi:hypothetical protein
LSQFEQQATHLIAERLDLRGYEATWIGAVQQSPGATSTEDLQRFQAELSLYLEKPCRVVSATQGLATLIAEVRQPPDDCILIAYLDGWDKSDWQAFDTNRSSFVRSGIIFLWLTYQSVGNLCSFAPNIRSFLGASIFVIGDTDRLMNEESKSARIQSLELYFQKSSAEVIRLAVDRLLPPEPEYIEWLILLGRGDLVR